MKAARLVGFGVAVAAGGTAALLAKLAVGKTAAIEPTLERTLALSGQRGSLSPALRSLLDAKSSVPAAVKGKTRRLRSTRCATA
jgi:hypothetical protein